MDTLGALKQAGFRLCIISNTDDAIIAGNVAQMGGHIDRVITAEQANAYKPSRQIFAHAHASLGVTPDDVVHICASPHLDHAAARDIGFRCVWIDRGTAANACLTTVPTLPYPPWIRSSACSAKRAGSDQRFPLTSKGCHEPRFQGP